MSRNVLLLRDMYDKEDTLTLQKNKDPDDYGFKAENYWKSGEKLQQGSTFLSPADFLRLLKWGAEKEGYRLVKIAAKKERR